MLYDKAKLLLILSLIIVILLSNTPFFEGKDISHNTTLAFTPPDPSQNNTNIQSTASPIHQTNNLSSDVSALVYKANALYNQGDYVEATQYYDKALAVDPNDKEALNGKGNAFYDQGNFAQAIQYYDKALAVDPNDKQALNSKGNSLYNQGNYKQAIQYYDKVLAVDPSYTDAIHEKRNALDGLASDVSALANGLYNQGNYTQAIEHYDKALAIDPKDTYSLNGKGNALSGQGNYTQAIQYYDKALTLDPKDKVILRNKAEALLNQARYDNTIPGQTYKQGDIAPAVQNYDKATQAIQYYDKALAIDPNYKEALSGKGSALDGIGNAFYNQGKYTRSIQYYNKALAINSTDRNGKQDAISIIAESAPTSGYNRGCIDAQIPNPSERYVNQLKNGPSFHSDAFMQAYKEGFDACSGNLPTRVETLKMFNVIVLKGNVTDETANTRICTTVSGEYSPQTICQNLDNLKPENGSNSIESNIFTFEGVPVNASFHSCIQRLIYPNVTLCDNYGSNNYQGPTIEQLILPFFGVDPAEAKDDEGYTICPQYLTEVQCYGKVVKTPDDGYDVNDTSIERANKSTTADHPIAGPLTDTPHKPRPVPPAAPGHANIQSRYGPGTEARADIDYQTGCNCVGKDCCYRGHKCDQSLGAECGPNIPGQCATLRLRFIAKNPCC